MSLAILRTARSASGVGADEVGVELAAIGQLDLDVAGAVDDVVVGDDIAARMDDEPAAEGVGGDGHDIASVVVPEEGVVAEGG